MMSENKLASSYMYNYLTGMQITCFVTYFTLIKVHLKCHRLPHPQKFISINCSKFLTILKLLYILEISHPIVFIIRS